MAPSCSSFETEASKKWPQFLMVSTACIAVFTTGLVTGWASPSLPKLMSDEYPFEVSNEEASYIAIISSLGKCFGGFAGYALLDKIGRRRTFQLIAVPQFLFFLLTILSYHLMQLLYVGRLIGGMAEGMAATIGVLYIGEIAEPKIRGALSTLVAITWCFGQLIINIVGSYLSIRDTSVTFIACPVIFVISFWKMPDSPYYLIMKNQEEQAIKSLQFLRNKTDVSGELKNLKADVARQMSETGSFLDIFSIESNRKAFFVTIGARLFQLASGATTFNLYLQILLKDATETLEPHIGSTIILTIQLVAAMCSPFIVDRLGRKPLLLFSSIGCFLNLSIQTVFFVLKEHTEIDLSVIDSLPLVMLIVHTVLYTAGLGVIVSVLTGEMFSASIKSKLTCLVNGVYSLCTFLVTKFYQATADGFGLTVPFAAFSIATLGGIFFFWCVLPETKGKSLEEIQQELKSKKNKK